MRRDGKRYLLLVVALLLVAAGGAFAQNYGPLPTPVIALNGTEAFDILDDDGVTHHTGIRYHLTVTNHAAYVDGRFASITDPPPTSCPSRTRVDIYDASDSSYIYGFCALGSGDNLTLIWFGVPDNTDGSHPPPPAAVYITLTDRITLEVVPSNTISVFSPTAPVANADTLTTNEDTTGASSVLTNDTDVNADTLSVTGIAVAPLHGTPSFSSTGVSYTPFANYNGTDSFSYSVFDGTHTSTATVSVTVTAVADPPVALGDSTSVAEDGSVTVGVLTNDYDFDTPYGDVVTLQSAGSPTHGTAGIVGGAIQYTPSLNYNGSDSFTYTIRDLAAVTSTATVSVTVTSVADAPNPPTTLLTDSAVNPNNVSSYLPRFSWVFSDVDQADPGSDSQTAYQIRIGTSPGTSTTWDSGMQGSLVSNAPYAGVALAPNTIYYWSVRVWDTSSIVSSYSASATFVILDIGLRVFDGTTIVRVATDYVGPSYKLRIHKSGTTYGIILVDPLDPSASKIRIMTPAGIKALKKM